MTFTTLCAAMLHCCSPSPSHLAKGMVMPGAASSPIVFRAASFPIPIVTQEIPGFHPVDSSDNFDGGPCAVPEAGFALILPRGFSRLTLIDGGGSSDTQGGLYLAVGKNRICGIGVMPIPHPLDNEAERRKFFEESMASTVHGLAENRKVELISQKEVTFAGVPGLSGRATITVGERATEGRIDICVANGRAYELFYFNADEATIDNPVVRSLFASFRVTEPDPTARASAKRDGRFAPKEGSFSIVLPPGSTEPIASTGTGPGGVTLRKYMSYTASGNYLITDAAASVASLGPDERKGMLASARDNELKALNAQPGVQVALKKEYDTTFGGIPHHVIIARGKDHQTARLYRIDIVIAEGSTYELMASTQSDDGRTSEAFDRFFSSFTVGATSRPK